MGFGIFGNTSSSKQQTPSWTSGSFPGAPAVHFVSSPGYSYASYSPVPTVWPVQQQQHQQQQTFVAVSPYHVVQPLQQVPVPVPVPVQVAQQTFAQSPTFTVMQQQHTVTTTPAPNTLLLRDVPSPKISHVIPRRSPRVQLQPELVQESYYLVPAQQQQQQQPQQQVVYSQQQQQPQQQVVYSQQQQPPQQQQQQQPSPMAVTVNLFTTPQQGPTPLPTPGPAPAPLLPPTGIHEVNDGDDDDDDPSGGHDHNPNTQNYPPHRDNRPQRHHQPNLRNPNPMPGPNTPYVPSLNISINNSPCPPLSNLVPTAQLPSPYSGPYQ